MDPAVIQSEFFSLGKSDVVRGLVTAIFTAVIVALASIAQQPGFDVFAMDWSAVAHTAFNVAFITLTGYLTKNFISDQNGKVLGSIG